MSMENLFQHQLSDSEQLLLEGLLCDNGTESAEDHCFLKKCAQHFRSLNEQFVQVDLERIRIRNDCEKKEVQIQDLLCTIQELRMILKDKGKDTDDANEVKNQIDKLKQEHQMKEEAKLREFDQQLKLRDDSLLAATAQINEYQQQIVKLTEQVEEANRKRGEIHDMLLNCIHLNNSASAGESESETKHNNATTFQLVQAVVEDRERLREILQREKDKFQTACLQLKDKVNFVRRLHDRLTSINVNGFQADRNENNNVQWVSSTPHSSDSCQSWTRLKLQLLERINELIKVKKLAISSKSLNSSSCVICEQKTRRRSHCDSIHAHKRNEKSTSFKRQSLVHTETCTCTPCDSQQEQSAECESDSTTLPVN